jgi:uncharacterized SAM-binding protein YcdF (DUF218 family)
MTNFVRRAASAAFDFLDIGQTPRKADCIFVFAGRPERKHYGLQLYRQGFAKTIIFSVGRFEWRRFPELGLADDGGLYRTVQEVPPPHRHFFVEMGPEGMRCTLVEKRTLGTMSEAAALSQWIEKKSYRSLLIVSSGFHLRRVVESVRHFSSKLRPEIIPVAVPSDVVEFDVKATTVAGELLKYTLYNCLLGIRSTWHRT